jgi:hypothetical protein
VCGEGPVRAPTRTRMRPPSADGLT